MRILVAGSGGREHAVVNTLSRRGGHDLHAAPGNPGMAAVCECHPVKADDIQGLVALASRLGADLVVPGPEAPLVAGIADALEASGIPCFGPSAACARLEGSKWFAKELMTSAGVRTAPGLLCTTPGEVREATGGSWDGWVLKDDGLAAGKGVFLPDGEAGAGDALGRLFPGGGGRVVVERRLCGREVSIMAICSGVEALVLPPSRDHKRAYDGDRGPNTGGMGAVCPAPGIPDGFEDWALSNVVRPVLGELRRRGADYRGVLYAGMILAPEGPSVLEFNCRFGDPEAQAVLALLEGDIGAVFLSCATGKPDFSGIEVLPGASACVVMASGGYPGTYASGFRIDGIDNAGDVTVFHAGTAVSEGRLVTAGGRVLGVTGTGAGLGEALERAYAAVRGITFEGAFWREDIGAV